MSNKIGRFEILSELIHSELGSVYKASDPESGQTVALKTLKLDAFGEEAASVVQQIMEETGNAKLLNSPNIAQLFGAEEIDGQFCASMEYVQGNSIATMLARKEGFSIWDLQDIARQTCQGLDHAHAKGVFHYSVEPANIVVTWDGTVKIVGFGISIMGAHAVHTPGPVVEALHYMSPEQLTGDPVDARSNLFSLGAILYEMVTERKAFNGDDADQVRQTILEMTPVAPDQINRKAHPALTEVIMKALAKSPEERYASGQDLINDLEKCKESATKAAATKKAVQPPQGLNLPQARKPAATASTPAPVKQTPVAVAPPKTVVPAMPQKPAMQEKKIQPPAPVAKAPINVPPPAPQQRPTPASAQTPSAGSAAATQKASAAAAGWGGPNPDLKNRTPKLDPSAQFISTCVKASVDAFTAEEAAMSAAPVAEPETESSGVSVDPMMAEAAASAAHGPSFSEIDELPPLKEVYIPPPPPEPMTEQTSAPRAIFIAPAAPEKPKVQPREVAKKAVKEIKKTPPQLFMYSIAGAVAVILLVVVGIALHIHNENADEDSEPVQSSAPASTAPSASSSAAQASPTPATAVPQTTAPEEVVAESSVVSVTPKYNSKKKMVKAPVPVATVVPGQLTVNSTPEGAQVRLDGRNEPGWVTPFNLTGLGPGQHTVTVNRPGYSTETRTIEVASGSKSFLVVQLAALAASVAVTTEPAGAAVLLDGKDTGKFTPVQLSVEKPGSHTLLVRKAGYVEETTTTNLQLGQTFHFAPALRPLGNTNEIKTVGKLKKMFGGGGDGAGMGVVSIKTQPKGAQVAINNRILDKPSPVDFYLNPGTYVLDVTYSGYKTIHRVINVDKGGKVALDETMDRE